MIKHNEEKRREKRKVILVVDDERGVREQLSRWLQHEGYKVELASNGEEAISLYKMTKPDLVCLDLRLPDINGFEVLETIRREDSSTPVIIITAYGNPAGMSKAFASGADDFIEKPLHFEKLLRNIERVLHKSHQKSKTDRLKNLISVLEEENKGLREKIKLLSGKRKDGVTIKDAEKYEAICGAVAHSLKGEFLQIGNSLKVLRDLTETLPDLQEECDIIERSVEYSQILLRRLLDYLDMGKPRLEPINALDLLRKTELLARPRLSSKIQLEITIDSSTKQRIVSASFEQLLGVLLELIQNACNVLREKGGTINIMFGERNGNVAISVQDNGRGIPLELRKNLFKKQVMSKNGLGLGLFLCNKVVRTLGGKLELETSSKRGTMLTILIPVVDNKGT